ncbi:MAG: AAA family ATPase [Candidatus Micrarchaeia archaeon]
MALARNPRKTAKESIAQEIIRRSHRTPISFYRMSSYLSDMVANPNFIDTIIVLFAFVAFAAAFPLYPYLVLVLLLVLLFFATQYHSFVGLITLMFFALLMIVYQTPAFAWIFLFAISMSLVYGYMHHRTIAFAYALFALAFSQMGYVLALATLTIAVLIVGYKRGIVLSTLVILAVAGFSGISGINNSAYVVYNGVAAHAQLVSKAPIPLSVLNYTTPTKQMLHITTFIPGLAEAFGTLGSSHVVYYISDVLIAFVSMLAEGYLYMIEIVIFAIVIFAIDAVAVSSRSKYKGTKASMVGIAFPITYMLLNHSSLNAATVVFALMSFAIAPALVALLELFNFGVVKSLDVRKQDIRMKFGEAFEDLSAGTSSETFDSIGDYEATKKELREAIITPIEQRGISKAYSIKPSKGILLFGPPGTGKTMMMRALANEIHGGFFLVKTPNLISAYPGETERAISRVFDTARKNAPCVLLFDEIDSIAKNRSIPEVDETHRQALSQLLIEIDGFVKLNRVVVVGATNVPNMIDPALLRPGRLDRLVYMQLPDFNGRKKIFKIYLAKMPIAKDVDIDALAENTERYSGADIKAVCESVAQLVGQDALAHHKILEVTQEDILNVIAATKPSTSLSQLDEYNKFRIDFERSLHEESTTEEKGAVELEDVIGLNDAKKAIVEAVQIPLMHPDLIEKYDIKPINGLLLFGPPGTGKTMLMRAVANEMRGVTILQINGEDLANLGPDNAVTEVKELFNRARENIPSIIFIDEIDGILPKREGASEKGTMITSTVLQEIDGLKEFSGIVIIAATNRPDALDPAMLRPGRFDKLLYIKPPNDAERAQMFKYYLTKAPLDESVDFEKLAAETKGFTGADISNICREAKTNALEATMKADEEVKITMDGIEGILKRMRPSAPDTVLSTYMTFLMKYGNR